MNVNSILNYNFIVFCSDHYNPLGVVRSLGEEGISPVVILVTGGSSPFLITRSKYPRHIHIVKTIEEGYSILLHKYALEGGFVYTCSDSIESYMDLHYDELKDHFFFFNGGSQGYVTKMMEKNEMCRLAMECGLNVPKTEELKVGELPKHLRYPVMTKSVISTVNNWKGNVFICKNEKELLDAYKHIKAKTINVQEFIEKENELCIDGISLNGGEELYMPLQSSYIRFTSKSYGNYILFEQFKEHDLYDKLQNLFKKVRFSGIFSVEFLRDHQDRLYFLEINFRNSTWSYAHTVGGINLPVIWAKSVLAGHIDDSDSVIKKTPFTGMVEMNDFLVSIPNRQVSLRNWIKDVKNCDCLFYYNKDDMSPFFGEIRFIIKYIIKRTAQKLFKNNA